MEKKYTKQSILKRLTYDEILGIVALYERNACANESADYRQLYREALKPYREALDELEKK